MKTAQTRRYGVDTQATYPSTYLLTLGTGQPSVLLIANVNGRLQGLRMAMIVIGDWELQNIARTVLKDHNAGIHLELE
jgi:hypothetical protein